MSSLGVPNGKNDLGARTSNWIQRVETKRNEIFAYEGLLSDK